jgi:hypothetical protein
MNAMPDQATAPAAIAKPRWQPVLFAPRPRRLELVDLDGIVATVRGLTDAEPPVAA